jgi:hypothetical protein
VDVRYVGHIQNKICAFLLQGDIASNVDVRYVDVKAGMSVGHIRCASEESARKLVNSGIAGCTLSLVQGL